MLTEKDYCDYDTCVALWSMGLIPHPYDNTDTDKVMAIISLYEAQKWLREERNIDVLPRRGCITNGKQHYQVVVYINYNRNQILLDNDGEDYSSPEEALSEGIKEAVKILKEDETIHE